MLFCEHFVDCFVFLKSVLRHSFFQKHRGFPNSLRYWLLFWNRPTQTSTHPDDHYKSLFLKRTCHYSVVSLHREAGASGGNQKLNVYLNKYESVCSHIQYTHIQTQTVWELLSWHRPLYPQEHIVWGATSFSFLQLSKQPALTAPAYLCSTFRRSQSQPLQTEPYNAHSSIGKCDAVETDRCSSFILWTFCGVASAVVSVWMYFLGTLHLVFYYCTPALTSLKSKGQQQHSECRVQE